MSTKTITMRNIKICWLTFFFFLVIFTKAYSQKNLSNLAKAYALVISPGKELYQAFGHNAFWIIDSVNKINLIFHYGTFDFRTKNFYLKFIRGRLNYMLSIQHYQDFWYEYTFDKRDVWALRLNLEHTQIQKLYNFLLWQSKEENKYYKYDFFYDNCATRLPYVLNKVFGDTIIYPSKNINITYRQAIRPYLVDRPWTRLGINLLLGLPADKKLSNITASFLPYYIDTLFINSKILKNSQAENFITERFQLIKSDFTFGQPPLINPELVLWLVSFLLIISLFWQKNKALNATIDKTIYLLLFFVSLVIIFMWFFTDHTPTKNNLNILWANPLLIIIILCKNPKILRYSYLTYAIITALLVILFPIFPQQFDIAIFPLLLTISLRNFIKYRTT